MPRTGVGPPRRFCGGVECQKALITARNHRHYEKHQKPIEPFICQGCGETIIPKIAKRGRNCCGKPECRKKQIAVLVRASYRRKHPNMKTRNRKMDSLVTHVPKEKKVVDGKVSLVDREAKLAGIDRGTREGFKRYMEQRPFYFQDVFPGKTIKEAWGMVGGR